MSSVLSVSGTSVDCARVVKMMCECNISGDVTSNTSVLDGVVEHGCRLRIVDGSDLAATRILWSKMQNEWSLTCAHVSWNVSKSGCVLDLLRASACPGVGKQS